MSIIDIIFLPIVFFLGVVTSYEDMRVSRIRLKWIKFGCFYALFGYGIFGLLNILKIVDYGGINPDYVKDYVFNAFISLGVSYMLWKMRAWTAGDAKLFVVYAMLIPLTYYSEGYLPGFPSFALLGNIFFPIFIYLLVIAVVHLVIIFFKSVFRKNRKYDIFYYLEKYFHDTLIKLKKRGGDIFAQLLAYLVMFTLAEVLINRLGLKPLNIVVFMIIFFKPLMTMLTKYPKTRIFAVLGLIFYFILEIVAGRVDGVFAMGARLFKLLFLFGGVTFLFKLYAKYTQVYEIEAAQLKPKMLISEDALLKFEDKEKGMKERLGPMYPDGLLTEQANFIKQLCSKYKCQKIKVYRTFPFAFWMFLGVIITLFIRQDVLSYFLSSTGISISF